MNGNCKPSQLYSHWQSVHKGNPAAEQLEARWRAAIKDKSLTLEQLDACIVMGERTRDLQPISVACREPGTSSRSLSPAEVPPSIRG